MKSTGPSPLLVDVYSKDFCDSLVEEIEEFHTARWVLRDHISSIPTKGTNKSHYYFCGDRQQPKDFNQAIRAVAPVIEGHELGEVCINRYDVNGYMPEHIDAADYRYNIVVALCEKGDGITVEGEWLEDKAGQAVVFPAFSVPHEVPPVKSKRYVLIFLYE